MEWLVILAYVAALFVLAAIVLVVIDRLQDLYWRRKNPPEKLAAERLAYRERIRNPDWAFFAAHLRRDVPRSLKDLYADHETVLADTAVFGDEPISFGAIDERGLTETVEWPGVEAVAIARNDSGDPIYLRPGADETNAVYVTYHDGGDTEQVSADVDEFIASIRLDEEPA
ncbi:MAG: hypothetical protein QNJ00_18065 [Woeseiaceae bacterium]|nr:hypothetical protein [Woeseiaceae bacterium]